MARRPAELTLSTILPSATRPHVEAILRAALRAADPQEALRRFLRCEQEVLSVQGINQVWSLRAYRGVYVLALGKAAFPMAKSIRKLLGNFIRHTLIITVSISFTLPDVEVLIGDHPIPGKGSLKAGQRLMEFVQ
ncbi:MAG: DUF4147 domain-containing protein, partial [Candidatus Methanomethylicaceae archaeon]